MTYSTFGCAQPRNMFQDCFKYYNNIKTYGFPVHILFMYSTSCTNNGFLSYFMYQYKIMSNLQVLQYYCTSCTSAENRFSQYRMYSIKFVLQLCQYRSLYSKNNYIQYQCYMYRIIFYNGTIDKIDISSSSTISNNTSSSSMLSTSSFM